MDKEQPLLYRLGITALTFFLFVWYFVLAFFPIGMIGLALIDWFGLPSEYVLPVCLCLAPMLLFVILHYLITPKKDDEGIYECLFHFTFVAEVFIVAICLINANVQDEISDAYLDGYDKGYQLSDVKLENEIYDAVSRARQTEYDRGYEYGYSDGWNAHSKTDYSDSSNKNTLQTKNEYRIVGVSNEDLCFWVECSIENLRAIIDAAETEKYEYTADYIVEKSEEAIRLLSILTKLDPSEETVTIDKDTWFEIYGNIKSIEAALEEADRAGSIDVDDVWGYIDNITWPDYVEYASG